MSVRLNTVPRSNTNFSSKRERKRARKGLVRGYIANRVAETRQGAAARAEFYRNLRLVKQRRAVIAKEMMILAEMIAYLRREVVQVGDRMPVRRDILEETNALVKQAYSSVSAASAEFALFSRRKVWYTEVVAA